VSTGKAVTPPLPHAGPVHLASFSANGRWLLTASGTDVRIWDAGTGEPISPPLKHARDGQPVRFMALSAEGQLVTEGAPGTRGPRRLAPDARPAAGLVSLARVVSGRRVEGIVLVPDEPADLRAAWSKLARAYPEDFDASGKVVRAWQRRGAAE